MEKASESNALIRFYGQRKHEQLNIPEVVRRSLDPHYNTSIFCHKQLPLLLAHNVRILDTLPSGLSAMPSINKVRRQYASSFLRLVKCPLPVDCESKKLFLDEVAAVAAEHAELNILHKMALGVLELKEHLSRHTKARLQEPDSEKQRLFLYRRILPEMRSIQSPLDDCNRHMIHFNFLCGQLAGLALAQKDPSRVGMVDRDLDLEKCVRFAVDDAKLICSNHYGDCPEVRFDVRWVGCEDEPLRISHLGGTTTYIITELMKNALRATMDAHAKRNSLGFVTCEDDMPPVKVLIHGKRGCRHATVCITDEGKGIARSHMDLVMSYTYTTAPKPVMEAGPDEEQETSPLAGYGYGLPMSRQYARCFGGDLVLQSQEGFGTNAYLYVLLDD